MRRSESVNSNRHLAALAANCAAMDTSFAPITSPHMSPHTSPGTGPLAGLKVIELGQLIANQIRENTHKFDL